MAYRGTCVDLEPGIFTLNPHSSAYSVWVPGGSLEGHMSSLRLSDAMATGGNKYLLIVFVTCVVWVQAACPTPWTSLEPEPLAPGHVGSEELGSVFCYCDHDRSVASKGLVTWRPGPGGGSSISHSHSRVHLRFFTCWIAH